MAYPFVQMPTVAQFIAFCQDIHGAELRSTNGRIEGPRGRVDIQYLFRQPSKKAYYTEALPTDFNERMTPDTLRRLCKQIGVSEKEFGLNLG